MLLQTRLLLFYRLDSRDWVVECTQKAFIIKLGHMRRHSVAPSRKNCVEKHTGHLTDTNNKSHTPD